VQGSKLLRYLALKKGPLERVDRLNMEWRRGFRKKALNERTPGKHLIVKTYLEF